MGRWGRIFFLEETEKIKQKHDLNRSGLLGWVGLLGGGGSFGVALRCGAGRRIGVSHILRNAGREAGMEWGEG